MLILGHRSLKTFTAGCAPAVPGSIGIKPRRTGPPLPIPALKSGAAGSPHGIPCPVGAEEADPCDPTRGAWPRIRGAAASPASPSSRLDFRVASCSAQPGSYRVHRAAVSQLRSPSLLRSAALANKTIAALNDFITVNCRPRSVNTGAATHLAARRTRASGSQGAGSGPSLLRGVRRAQGRRNPVGMPQTLRPRAAGAERGRAQEPCKRTQFAAVPVARRCRHGGAQRPRRRQTEQTAICKQLLGLNRAGAAAPRARRAQAAFSPSRFHRFHFGRDSSKFTDRLLHFNSMAFPSCGRHISKYHIYQKACAKTRARITLLMVPPITTTTINFSGKKTQAGTFCAEVWERGPGPGCPPAPHIWSRLRAWSSRSQG